MSVPPVAGTIPDNLADLVGNTPMVRLTRLAPDCGAELLAKLEAYNPAGSVKDRIGVAMIEAAEAEGRIEPGRNTIVESTSGNTGIALAFVAAAKGYELVVTLPQGMSREREKLLRLYGAEVVLVETMGGMNEAVEEARRICRERGDCWVPNQFSNPANPEIHRRTTAEEIWRDCDGRVDVLVAGVGTGGTITGCGERLKEHNPDLHVVAVEPKSSPVLSGGRPGPAQDRRDRRRLRARGAQPRGDRRGDAGGRRGRDRHRAPLRRPRGRARRAVLRRRAVGARSRWARARSCAASGSWRSCRTRASATPVRHSSLPRRCSAWGHSPAWRASCART